MKIDTKNLVSMTEANQNFSNVVKKIEQSERVIILKNNRPKYVLSKIDDSKEYIDENQFLTTVANIILTEHHKAFEELGK